MKGIESEIHTHTHTQKKTACGKKQDTGVTQVNHQKGMYGDLDKLQVFFSSFFFFFKKIIKVKSLRDDQRPPATGFRFEFYAYVLDVVL